MKLKKIREDIIVMALLLAGCAYFLLYGIAAEIPESPAARGMTFTPRTFPTICITLIGICALIGFVKNVIQYTRLKRTLSDEAEKPPIQKSVKARIGSAMPLICFALCVLYAYIFSTFGFIAATIIVPPVLLLVLGCRKWQYYVSVYGFCVCMYIIFVIILKVRLP